MMKISISLALAASGANALRIGGHHDNQSGDGHADGGKVLATHHKVDSKSMGSVETLFQALDVDGNGCISKSEFDKNTSSTFTTTFDARL